MRIVATTFFLAALTACTAVGTVRDDSRVLANFRDQYLAAFNRCDVDALLLNYSTDFTFVSQAVAAPLTTLEQVRHYYARICALNPKPQVTLLDHRIVAGETVGALHGIFLLAQPSPGTLRLKLHGTLVLQRFGEAWRIVAYHTSGLPTSSPP